MTFVLTRQDIQELLSDARYRAERCNQNTLTDFFTTPNFIRSMLGQLIHNTVNSHFDPGMVLGYREIVADLTQDLQGDEKEVMEYAIHELYLGLRSTIDPWVDRGWLYDVEAIEDKTMAVDRLSGFLITPLISPRIADMYADKLSTSEMIELLNTKTY